MEDLNQDGQSALTARGARNVHGFLLAGNVILAIAFEFVIRFNGAPLADIHGVGTALSGAVLVILAVAIFVLRPRIARRDASLPLDAYWSDQQVHKRTMQLWKLLEGAGTLALVGYLFTGETIVAAMALCAIGTFAWFRPARLEG